MNRSGGDDDVALQPEYRRIEESVVFNDGHTVLRQPNESKSETV